VPTHCRALSLAPLVLYLQALLESAAHSHHSLPAYSALALPGNHDQSARMRHPLSPLPATPPPSPPCAPALPLLTSLLQLPAAADNDPVDSRAGSALRMSVVRLHRTERSLPACVPPALRTTGADTSPDKLRPSGSTPPATALLPLPATSSIRS